MQSSLQLRSEKSRFYCNKLKRDRQPTYGCLLLNSLTIPQPKKPFPKVGSFAECQIVAKKAGESPKIRWKHYHLLVIFQPIFQAVIFHILLSGSSQMFFIYALSSNKTVYRKKQTYPNQPRHSKLSALLDRKLHSKAETTFIKISYNNTLSSLITLCLLPFLQFSELDRHLPEPLLNVILLF